MQTLGTVHMAVTVSVSARVCMCSILLLLSDGHLLTLMKSLCTMALFSVVTVRTVLGVTVSQNWIINVYQNEAVAMIYNLDELKTISQPLVHHFISVVRRNFSQVKF